MSDPGALRLARDVVSASGPESAGFLQGQLSQDLLVLPEGGSAWSWLLAPNGKVDALVRVTRSGPDQWWVDTDAGWGDAVLTRLQRFRLRTKVELEVADLQVVGIRGAGWERLALTGTVIAPPWPGVEGADVIGPGSALPPGSRPLGEQEYEAARIIAGMPKMGAELDERTIPGETGLVAQTVSFTKGCYTGQELVARVDSRGGNVPRRLRGLRFDQEVPAGAELTGSEGQPAGVVTSSAPGPGGWVGLGYVKRGVDPAEVLTAGPVAVRQVELGQ